jgi:hypothetical protein
LRRDGAHRRCKHEPDGIHFVSRGGIHGPRAWSFRRV